MVLQIIWFLLVGVLIAGYGLLGGYDMGVGCLYLFQSDRNDRRKMLNAIGPYWDANQVWLITAGGALFAAFPFVFATVFSGFYLAMILVLFGLVIRTVSIEFRLQLDSPAWNKIWDLAFGVGSILPSLLLGVAVGNILRGIPLDANTNFAGSFFSLLNPYALLMGVFSLTMFTMQGASFLMVSQPSLRNKVEPWAKGAWLSVAVLFLLLTAGTIVMSPHLLQNLLAMPVLFIFPLLVMVSLLIYPLALKGNKKWTPIMASSLTILGSVGTAGASLFPRLVPNLNSVDQYVSYWTGGISAHLQNSLTAFNASSSPLTLTVMLIVAGIGVPIVLAYTIYVYRTLNRPAETVSRSSQVTG